MDTDFTRCTPTAYADQTRKALGSMLRSGNAGANTAADDKAVLDLALARIPADYIERMRDPGPRDSAGAMHELADYCRGVNMHFSVGYELTKTVRTAILQTPEDAWVPALDQDDSQRESGEVAELTDDIDLSSWPEAGVPQKMGTRGRS
jgi:hypothetical protein